MTPATDTTPTTWRRSGSPTSTRSPPTTAPCRSGPAAYLATVTDLDRVVDERWDPPVTLGVRLVSVLDDAARHVGQAQYLRGLVDRRA